MEMFQIKYMLAASRTLNFTRAAAECNVSQPALTKAVKALEDELGAPLFHREGKRLRISEFGQSILPHLPFMNFMLLHAVSFFPSHNGIYWITCCRLLHTAANHCIIYGGRKDGFLS